MKSMALSKWREPLYHGDKSVADFGQRIEEIRANEGVPSDLSVDDLNRHLNGIASVSKYSDIHGPLPS